MLISPPLMLLRRFLDATLSLRFDADCCRCFDFRR